MSAIVCFCVGTVTAFSEELVVKKPSAKVIELETHGKDYLQLLSGLPDSVAMKAGLVVLASQESVGKHSTDQHEEILVVVEGKGEMTFKDKPLPCRWKPTMRFIVPRKASTRSRIRVPACCAMSTLWPMQSDDRV